MIGNIKLKVRAPGKEEIAPSRRIKTEINEKEDADHSKPKRSSLHTYAQVWIMWIFLALIRPQSNQSNQSRAD